MQKEIEMEAVEIIEKLEVDLAREKKLRAEAMVELGTAVLARDEYRRKYEHALGSLRFAMDRVDALVEEKAELKAELKRRG